MFVDNKQVSNQFIDYIYLIVLKRELKVLKKDTKQLLI